MSYLRKSLSLGLLAGVLAVVPAVQGQVRVMPSFSAPSASTRIGAANANYSQRTQGGNQPYRYGGFNRGGWGRGGAGWGGGYGGGGWGGGWGYNNFMMDPGYGYLSGASQVISSQAEFMKAQQETNLTREQVKQAKLDTQRKTFDEWRYEQANQPTAEEQRVRRENAELARMRNNPPSVDIWSGDAMNTLLFDLIKLQGMMGPGPTVMVAPDVLPKISVTDGKSYGSGLLKDGGKLTWPYSLEYDFFVSSRKKMDQLMGTAMGQLMSGQRPAPRVIQDMLATEDVLRADLKDHIRDLTPSQGVEARRYLNDLHETIRTLQDPNAANFASGKWSARGENVAELVMNMSRDGLKFAPARPGNEVAYNSLYQSMVQYDRFLASVAARPPSTGGSEKQP